MHDWNDRYEHGFRAGHWLLGGTMVLFWIAVIAGIVLLVRAYRSAGGAPSVRAIPRALDAQQILDERLAKGEIDIDDYRSRSDALKSLS